jgi:hypothetical protein
MTPFGARMRELRTARDISALDEAAARELLETLKESPTG